MHGDVLEPCPKNSKRNAATPTLPARGKKGHGSKARGKTNPPPVVKLVLDAHAAPEKPYRRQLQVLVPAC